MTLVLGDVAATSVSVAATSSRTAKVAALAELFGRASVDELPIVVTLLAGAPRQGRIGVGWATLSAVGVLPPGAGGQVTVAEFDAVLDELAATTGEGSTAARAARLAALLARTDEAERSLVAQVLGGGLRQGALEGLVLDAVALATATPAAAVRRALMLTGDLGLTAGVARTGGAAGLAAQRLEVGRPLRPMLAASSGTVGEALAHTGVASVEIKLDGARIQVHRDGDAVAVFTRNLNDITARLPEVVAAVAALPGRRMVLDGELIGLDEAAAEGAAPRLFQETISRFASARGGDDASALSPFFFDCLHLDGDDLLDAPLATRLDALDRAAGRYAVPRLLTADAAAAEAFAAQALAQGHEGVMVKALDQPYVAGRRGAAWRKVKPVRTLDLVVLAAEWGHGRRRGRLSNLHLGARDPDHPDRFVMVGKTFKGLTDAMLAWQTEQLLARQVRDHAGTVTVGAELVVEIALDGVQRSSRYPGGVALRFARVRRYRPDKAASEADLITTVQAMLPERAR